MGHDDLQAVVFGARGELVGVDAVERAAAREADAAGGDDDLAARVQQAGELAHGAVAHLGAKVHPHRAEQDEVVVIAQLVDLLQRRQRVGDPVDASAGVQLLGALAQAVGRLDGDHVVAAGGQRGRVPARARADVEHLGAVLGQVLQNLVVDRLEVDAFVARGEFFGQGVVVVHWVGPLRGRCVRGESTERGVSVQWGMARERPHACSFPSLDGSSLGELASRAHLARPWLAEEVAQSQIELSFPGEHFSYANCLRYRRPARRVGRA